MPLYNSKQRTIYNGNSVKSRFRSAQPPLGNTAITRQDLDVSNKSSEDNEKNNPFNNIRRQRDESILKMNVMSKHHTDVLFRTKTVFPFDLFPDTLTISPSKIEIKINSFFFTYSTVTIPLQDIGFVELDKSVFFSSLSLINIRRYETPVILNYLMTRDAIYGKKIINGLLIAQEAGVDVSVVEPKELLTQLVELGD